MGYIVRMPKLGLEMEEGTVVEWHVSEGEEVSEDDLVAEIESEKAVAEVESREDGVMRRIILDVGDTTEPGAAMGIVAGPDEDIGDLEAEIEAEIPEPAEEEPAEEPEDVSGEKPAAEEGGAATEEATSTTAVKASPRAKKRAEELGVDLENVEGTGPGGAITAEDVEAAPAGEMGPAKRSVAEVVEFDGMRRTIAKRLSESARNAVQVTEHRAADAEAIFEATERAQETMDTYVWMPDVLLVAISATLDEHLEFNATYEDETHTIYQEHNIGWAVDIDEGLISPVIPDVGAKELPEISDERLEISKRAIKGEYTMDDLANGTFTVSDLSDLGLQWFNPVINPPQVAILGVNSIQERAEQTERGIEFRRKIPFSFTFDHRVVDGADAARFLQTLIAHVEDPWPLLPSEVQKTSE